MFKYSDTPDGLLRGTIWTGAARNCLENFQPAGSAGGERDHQPVDKTKSVQRERERKNISSVSTK